MSIFLKNIMPSSSGNCPNGTIFVERERERERERLRIDTLSSKAHVLRFFVRNIFRNYYCRSFVLALLWFFVCNKINLPMEKTC